MTEHTKGKLSMSPGKRTIDICASDMIPWVRITHISSMSPEDIANARRLVACWNACEAFTTEALEGGIVARCFEESFALDGEGDDPCKPT